MVRYILKLGEETFEGLGRVATKFWSGGTDMMTIPGFFTANYVTFNSNGHMQKSSTYFFLLFSIFHAFFMFFSYLPLYFLDFFPNPASNVHSTSPDLQVSLKREKKRGRGRKKRGWKSNPVQILGEKLL